jgi:hypothetical protein
MCIHGSRRNHLYPIMSCISTTITDSKPKYKSNVRENACQIPTGLRNALRLYIIETDLKMQDREYVLILAVAATPGECPYSG